MTAQQSRRSNEKQIVELIELLKKAGRATGKLEIETAQAIVEWEISEYGVYPVNAFWENGTYL